MRLDLKSGFYLSPVCRGDQAAYLEHFRDQNLVDALLLVPFPYTREDADAWVETCLDRALRLSAEYQFALRREDGLLVGGAGLVPGRGVSSHRAELGYWLAEGYRGRGLVQAAVHALVGHGFESLGLRRIEASIDPNNLASRHLLEKEGFACEGLARAYYLKNGHLLDRCLYGLVRA